MYDFIICIFTYDNWEKRRLGNLSKIVRGASPRPIKDPKWFDENSDIGWLRIADVTKQNGKVHFLEQHLSKLGQEKTRVLKSPHLLLSIAATVGSPVINYVPTGVHDGFLIFLDPKFNKLFMFQWLQYFKNYWNKYGQPGSQVNLNSDLVRNQQLYIPSEEEQIKISDFLKLIDDKFNVSKRKLDKLKLLKKALLQQLFPQKNEVKPRIRFTNFNDDWEKRKLGELIKSYSGGTPESSNKINYGGDIPFIRSGEIKNSNTKLKLTEQGMKNSSAKKVKKGNILYAMYGANSGEVNISKINGAINQAILAIIPSNEKSNFFIYQTLNTNKQRIINVFLQGGQGNLSRKIINNLNFKFPIKIKEQEKIGSVLSLIDHLIHIQQSRIKKYEELKKALLQKMFL